MRKKAVNQGHNNIIKNVPKTSANKNMLCNMSFYENPFINT